MIIVYIVIFSHSHYFALIGMIFIWDDELICEIYYTYWRSADISLQQTTDSIYPEKVLLLKSIMHVHDVNHAELWCASFEDIL